MKRVLSFLFLLNFIRCVNAQNSQYIPWGIWDYEPAGVGSPIKELPYGKYYYSRSTLSWIGISQNSKGIIAGNYDFPLLAEDGTFVKIEKYERAENSFILYLVGDGIKHDKSGPKFKDDVRIKLKMTFISDDECHFQYYSVTDPDGFRLTFLVKENYIYRRYKVQPVVPENIK